MSGNATWTSENDEILIDFVKKHEALYNMKIKEYRQVQLKRNLWDNIGTTLQKSGSDCCKRWAYVRDYYIRRKGKLGTGSGGEAAKKRSDFLSFLDSLPSSQRHNTIGDEVRLDESEITEDTLADIEEYIGQIDETENITIINFNEVSNNKKKNGRRDDIIRDKKKKKITHSEERLQLLKQITERKTTPAQNKLDETDLFFNSIAKIVKTLPRYEQVQLRMQISSLVGNAELKNIPDDSRQINNESLLKPSSTMNFIYSKTMPSPSTNGTLNDQGQIYYVSDKNISNEPRQNSESSTPSTGKDVSESALCLPENDQGQFFFNM